MKIFFTLRAFHFGVGGSPFPRMDGRKIANLLQEGCRMPKPQQEDDNLCVIIVLCFFSDGSFHMEVVVVFVLLS